MWICIKKSKYCNLQSIVLTDNIIMNKFLLSIKGHVYVDHFQQTIYLYVINI